LHPHITIYQPEYPISSFDEVIDTANEVVNKITKTKFVFKKIDRYQSSLWIVFELTRQIKDIHELVVKKFNPLRKEHQRKKFQPGSTFYSKLSPEQQKNCRKYGHPSVISAYSPHITIIRLQNKSLAKKELPNLMWEISQFVVGKIAVYKEGKHGTCKELVKEFPLK
jgi:2'-5' RNA ligase